MPDADVQLKQTVAICHVYALYFLCVFFRLHDLSRAASHVYASLPRVTVVV